MLNTPSRSYVQIGPFTLHFYALCILLGIITAIALSIHRSKETSVSRDQIFEIATLVIPVGIVGGRLYHVISSPHLYFDSLRSFLNIFKIWEGGMGIWGAIFAGVVSGWIYARRRNLDTELLLTIVTPGLLFAQSIGRWGNWFNGELFGSPTSLPWALHVPLYLRPHGYEGFTTFHPVFLYESLWCLVGGIMLLRVKAILGKNLFALYVVWYCTGRTFLELLRIDSAPHFFGMRLNFWVSLAVLLAASVYFLKNNKNIASKG